MSGFIRVIGDDARYKGRAVYMFVATSAICTVQPMWAVKEDDGKFWKCTDDHEGAEIISYRLVDMHGHEYACANEGELQKLGIEIGSPKPKIGFLLDEEGGKTAVEVS